jgi:hypothetical protein
LVTGIAKRRGTVALAFAAVAALLLSMTLPFWPMPVSEVSANVNGMSATTLGPVNTGTQVIITIDADNGGGDVRVIATSGVFNDSDCAGSLVDFGGTEATANDCALDAASANLTYDAVPGAAPEVRDILIDDGAADAAGGNVDTIILYWTSPLAGPASSTITATQGGVSKTVTITTFGNAATVDLRIMRAASTSALICQGTDVNVMMSASGAAGLGGVQLGVLCTKVTDSAGNVLVGQPVVYTTNRGSLLNPAGSCTLVGTTNANGIDNQFGLVPAPSACPTPGGDSGTTATVTATSGTATATKDVKFGGTPATCVLTSSADNVPVGQTVAMSADIKDSTSGPTWDNLNPTWSRAHPGASGSNVVIASTSNTSNGVARANLFSAIPGEVQVTAAIGGALCSSTVTFTGVTGTATPSGTGTATGTATGACTVTPNSPYQAGLNAVVVQGSCTAVAAAGVVDAATALNVLALWVLSGGTWLYFLPQFPAINGGLSQFPGPVASAIVVLS